jgi:hypothetical protein
MWPERRFVQASVTLGPNGSSQALRTPRRCMATFEQYATLQFETTYIGARADDQNSSRSVKNTPFSNAVKPPPSPGTLPSNPSIDSPNSTPRSSFAIS